MENINNRCLPLLKAQFTPATSIYESYFFLSFNEKNLSLHTLRAVFLIFMHPDI